MGGNDKGCSNTKSEWRRGIEQETNHNYLNLVNNDTHYNCSCSVIPPSSTQPSAILDSGCTGHYFPPDIPVTNKQPNYEHMKVTLPDSSTITATHTATVPIPTLDEKATKTFIFPTLHSALLSVGQLCDSGCSVTFNKNQVKVYNKTNILIFSI